MSEHAASNPHGGSPRQTIDVYELLRDIEDLLRRRTGDGVRFPRQAWDPAAALVAGLVSAAGLVPTVESDTMDPRVFDGLDALTAVQHRQHDRRSQR